MDNKLRLIPIVSIVLLIIVPICGSMATDHIRTLELNDNKNSLITDLNSVNSNLMVQHIII